MLILISPAKTLDFDTPVWTKKHTEPRLMDSAQKLADRLKKKSPGQLAKLMSLSKDLAALNAKRYADWQYPFDPEQARQAIFAFEGDVYLGLDVHEHFEDEDLEYAQNHLRILSGLYGVLRPLDNMMPYRLEMGTKLKVGRPNNLYEFWGESIANLLQEDLDAQGDEIVVNLASQEYWKAAHKKSLNATVITPEFKDWKNGQYKMLSFFAKKARGLMTRYLLTERIDTIEGLKAFNLEGYSYNKELSSDISPVFTRKA